MIARRCGNTKTTTAAAAVSSRHLSDAAVSAAPTQVKLTFGLPHETIYQNASVSSVIVPGLSGEYGITAGHVPYVAQLKPGVLQILHDDTSEPEKYFVPGGYAMTHADSSTVRAPMFFLILWKFHLHESHHGFHFIFGLFLRIFRVPKPSNWTISIRPLSRNNLKPPRMPLVLLHRDPWNKRKHKSIWK